MQSAVTETQSALVAFLFPSFLFLFCVFCTHRKSQPNGFHAASPEGQSEVFSNTVKRRLSIYTRGQIVENKGWSRPHAKRGRMMGSFETVEALQRQQMFDPSSAHLALNALNPFHSTSLSFFFSFFLS